MKLSIFFNYHKKNWNEKEFLIILFRDEISKQIIELLDERIKPAVNMDGGDISFVKFDLESGIVYVKLKGSCSGCPSSKITLQSGIKRTLQHYIPEVSDVAEA